MIKAEMSQNIIGSQSWITIIENNVNMDIF